MCLWTYRMQIVLQEGKQSSRKNCCSTQFSFCVRLLMLSICSCVWIVCTIFEFCESGWAAANGNSNEVLYCVWARWNCTNHGVSPEFNVKQAYFVGWRNSTRSVVFHRNTFRCAHAPLFHSSPLACSLAHFTNRTKIATQKSNKTKQQLK